MLPSLKVKIGADTTELDRKLGDTQARLRRFARVAAAATVAVATATAALFQRTSQAIDAQAKLAQSLGTTVRSIQVLERAGELAGVTMSGIEQATKDLTRRLSQAAAGTGPAADALGRLNLSAGELMAMPLDERVEAINSAIRDFIPAAEQAAVAGQLFGEEGSIAMSRLDSETIRQATRDVEDFGVALSEAQANSIEAANDALSRIGLVFRGVANQITAALAPAVETLANAFTNALRIGQPLREFLEGLLGRIASIGAVIVTGVALWGAYALAIRGAAAAVALLNGALVITRAALIRTGIGVAVVAAGELVYQLSRLVTAVGGFGEAMNAVGDVFDEVFERMRMATSLLGEMFGAAGAIIQGAFLSAFAVVDQAWIDLVNRVMRGVNSVAQAMNNVFGTNFGMADMMPDSAMGAQGAAMLSAGQAIMESAAGSLSNVFTEPLQSVQALRDTIAEASEATETLGETTQVVTDSMAAGLNNAGGAAQNLETVLTAAQERGKAAAEMIGSKMEDAMMSMIDGTKSAGEAFRDMARSVIAELYRIFVVKRITGFITRAISGAFGVPATGTAGPPSFEGGGFTGAGSRSGGIDGRGGFPAILHPNETVVDHTRGSAGGLGGMGGSVVVNQTINVTTGVQQTVRAEIKNLLPQISETAKAAVVDAKRRGGSYGRAFA